MSPRHKELRKLYIEDLRQAMAVAQAWWKAMLAKELDESLAAAASEVKRRWPDGPASHPVVIGVIERYLKACDELNAIDPDSAAYLNEFIIDGLDTVGSQDVLAFTDALTYWPIGLDDQGHPV